MRLRHQSNNPSQDQYPSCPTWKASQPSRLRWLRVAMHVIVAWRLHC